MKTRPTLLTLTLLFAALPLFAALNAYMKIDGIPGGSTDAAHPGWIEIASFSSSMNPGEGHVGSGGASHAGTGEFKIMKRADKSSPLLFQDAVSGAHLRSVTIDIGGMRHVMQNATVTSVRRTGDSLHPIEEVSFTYEKQEMETGGRPGPLTGVRPNEIALNVRPNAAIAFGTAPGPILLQDLRFTGPNQAVLTLKGDQMLLPAVRQFLQTKQAIPEVRISSGMASGRRMHKPISFVFHNATVSSYTPAGIGGWEHLTINFSNTDGPMVAFHDDSVE